MKIIHFPPPERYSHRREISAIPTWYRVRAHAEENPLTPRRLLGQAWVALAAALLFWLAVTVASAGTLNLAQLSPPPASTTATPIGTPSAAASPLSNSNQQQPPDDIRDIRGPVHITPSWTWLLWTIGTLAVAGLIYAAVKWWKSRIKARAKLPHEVALEALEKARAFMSPDQVREYSFTVSEITRNYIEARFGARAAHRTTEEFLHDLVAKPTGGLANHAGLLEDFLKHCDLVKFARWKLSLDEMENMHASAVIFVSQTRPLPEGVKPASAPEQEPVAAAIANTER